MRVSVLLKITGDDGVATPAEEIAAFDKATERLEDLGLSIAEGKTVLAAVQSRTVKAQAAAWSERNRSCAACDRKRHGKGSYPVVFHTLYGDVELDSPRLYCCPCQKADGPATVSPLRDLIGNRVAPERLYLEARWASLVPYASAAGLLSDLLPLSAGMNATTLRQHVLHVAERTEGHSATRGRASSTAARPNGRNCRSRKVGSWSASMAAMSGTGTIARPTLNLSSVARSQRTGRHDTSA